MPVRIEKIEEKLRNNIINSGLKEFSLYGYEKASLNNILSEAEISKGRFYQYVKGKKEFYDYLIEFFLNSTVDTVSENVDWTKGDILERLKETIKIRINTGIKYPYLFKFAYMINREVEFRDYLAKKKKDIDFLRSKYHSDSIDKSKFKDNSNLEEHISIIKWTYNSLMKDHFEKADYNLDDENINELYKEIEKYALIFKSLFYKN